MKRFDPETIAAAWALIGEPARISPEKADHVIGYPLDELCTPDEMPESVVVWRGGLHVLDYGPRETGGRFYLMISRDEWRSDDLDDLVPHLADFDAGECGEPGEPLAFSLAERGYTCEV